MMVPASKQFSAGEPDRIIFINGRGTAFIGTCPGQHVSGMDAACTALLNRATPPEVCGPEIPVAPARGPMLHFTPRRMEVTESGGIVRRHDGGGRDAARVADVFDLMEKQARNRHARAMAQAEARGEERLPRFHPPFSIGQVEIGREYAALTERCDAAGVKCSSLEALHRAGGGGGDREEAIFRDFHQLRSLHRRIGDGVVKQVRRQRPGGRKRSAIRARHLVDEVCLSGRSLSEVLERCGWNINGEAVEALRRDLGAVLDRMRGFGEKGA